LHPSLEPGAVELLVALEQAGALTPTGLTLTDPDLPIGQAEAIGTLLGRMHMSVRFAIGDWLLFIENVYPDEWSQLAEVLGLSTDTRREYMRVSERVPRSRRRPKLDWSQHRAVAALPPPEQKEWLKKAEVEQLSHHALREALRDGKPEVVPTHCRCCQRPL
jgi:hypothetical protein